MKNFTLINSKGKTGNEHIKIIRKNIGFSEVLKMGISYMSKEREDNLIEINVYGHGCIEGLYNCEGRFDTAHLFSDGFEPDDGWYRIADYTAARLKYFKDKGV